MCVPVVQCVKLPRLEHETSTCHLQALAARLVLSSDLAKGGKRYVVLAEVVEQVWCFVEGLEKQLLLEKALLQLLMSNEDSGAVLNRAKRKGRLADLRPILKYWPGSLENISSIGRCDLDS